MELFSKRSRNYEGMGIMDKLKLFVTILVVEFVIQKDVEYQQYTGRQIDIELICNLIFL